MTGPHPGDALVGYVRNELGEAERRRVAAHLEGCEACRGTVGDFQVILERLADTPLPVSDPHWGRYRAELRGRLQARPAPWRAMAASASGRGRRGGDGRCRPDAHPRRACGQR